MYYYNGVLINVLLYWCINKCNKYDAQHEQFTLISYANSYEVGLHNHAV